MDTTHTPIYALDQITAEEIAHATDAGRKAAEQGAPTPSLESVKTLLTDHWGLEEALTADLARRCVEAFEAGRAGAAPQPVSIHHSIVFVAHTAEIDREEVSLTYVTAWRGKPARLSLRLDRYRHSSGLSDWRIVPFQAVAVPAGKEDDPAAWPALSDTARFRLAADLGPAAEAWLASDAYRQSRRAGLISGLKTSLRGVTEVGRSWLVDAFRARLEAFGGEIGPEAVKAFDAAVAAWEAFEAAYGAIPRW